MKSIIKKLVFDVGFGRTDTAFQVHDEISGLCRTDVIEALDEVCSSVEYENRYIQLGLVEIDIGRVSLSELEKEFAEKVKKAFSEELSARINCMHQGTIPSGEASGRPDDGLAGAWATGPDGDGRIITQEGYEVELLRHFLCTGSLPWWANREPFNDMERRFASLLKEKAAGMRTFLRLELGNRASMRRLVYQFSDEVLLAVAALLADGEDARIPGVVRELCTALEKMRPATIDERGLRFVIWEAALTKLLTGAVTQEAVLVSVIGSVAEGLDIQGPGLAALVEEALQHLSRHGFLMQSVIPDIIADMAADGLAGREYGQLLRTGMRRSGVRTYEETADTAVDKNLGPEALPVEMYGPCTIEGENRTDVRQDPAVTLPGPRPFADGRRVSDDELAGLDTSRAKYAAEVQKTYIENAGMVLLWPYLGVFFENCGLFEDGVFSGDKARTRAIHLLQYLSTGKEQAPEYLLSLNKLLCGLDVSEPVDRHVVLSDSEKSEAGKLLGTVISHWQALKNTSPEGFQTSFLQRDGALSKKDDGWHLQVERKSFDLLLDSLPWSISIVRSSWMNTAVYVEW